MIKNVRGKRNVPSNGNGYKTTFKKRTTGSSFSDGAGEEESRDKLPESGALIMEHDQRTIEEIIWHCRECPNFKPNFIQKPFRDGLRGYCKKGNFEIYNASADIPLGCPLPKKDYGKK